MVFHCSLSDSKSPQVSRIIIGILAVLNNAEVWMVSTHPPTSKSSCLFNSSLVTVPNAPIRMGIIVYFMLNRFLNSLAMSKFLCFIIIYSFRVFHISVRWWFFTGVWVTASLLKSPGLVSGFWPSSAMLSFGESLPVRQLPSPPGPLIIL